MEKRYRVFIHRPTIPYLSKDFDTVIVGNHAEIHLEEVDASGREELEPQDFQHLLFAGDYLLRRILI